MLASRFENASDVRMVVTPKGQSLIGAALVAGVMIFASAAQAAPLSFGKSATAAFESDVSLVRDGCGRGMRFSNRRGECVPDNNFRDDRRFNDGRHDGRNDGRRGNKNDAAVAIATGAAVLGIIAAGNKNKNNNNGQVKVNNGNKSGKHKNP